MNYEKAYKEALERARVIHYNEEEKRSNMEWLFPELKESEDERIRKAIISGMTALKDQGRETFASIPINDCITWLEKQGENSIRWDENTDDNKPKKHHSMLMKTTHGVAEGEWQGEKWFQYRWSSRLKDSDVLFWIELSDIEKRGEKKPKENKGNIGGISTKWSVEDKAHIESILERLEGMCKKGATFTATRFAVSQDIDWLKSLRPQNKWKPSDEQIKVCKEVYADILSAKGFDLGTVVSELNRMEEQLKKLKEGKV